MPLRRSSRPVGAILPAAMISGFMALESAVWSVTICLPKSLTAWLWPLVWAIWPAWISYMSLITALVTKASVETGPGTAAAVASWAALTAALLVPGSAGVGAASFF